jgi:hypothetical protein
MCQSEGVLRSESPPQALVKTYSFSYRGVDQSCFVVALATYHHTDLVPQRVGGDTQLVGTAGHWALEDHGHLAEAGEEQLPRNNLQQAGEQTAMS